MLFDMGYVLQAVPILNAVEILPLCSLYILNRITDLAQPFRKCCYIFTSW